MVTETRMFVLTSTCRQSGLGLPRSTRARTYARAQREREREKGGRGGWGRQGGREGGRETERSLHVSESIFSYVQGGVRHTLSYIVIHCHTYLAVEDCSVSAYM